MIETTSHPFVIRIWLEETAEEAGEALWRGHVTHVPTGTRHYLRTLGDIITFISPYLEGMGIQPEVCSYTQSTVEYKQT